MFVREKKFKSTNRSYLQIVENHRVDGRVKQKVILSLGCLQSLKKSGELKRLAKSFLKYCQEDFPDINEMEEERRIHWGVLKIIEKFWQLFDFEAIFQRCCKGRSIKSDFYQPIELMLADRFISPCSKLRSYEKQEKYANKEVELHQLYITLDYLAEFKEQIEKELFEKNLNLFNMQVNLVFYDATTLHFESELVDQLRDFGFAKNGKYNEVQVVLGLLVDLEGRPIGFDVFPGNLYEGHTLKRAIEKLQERFSIEKVIVVADRGMLSSDNLKLLRSSGYQFIISARLKKLPKTLQQEVLDLDSYSDLPNKDREKGKQNKDEENDQFKYKIYKHPNVFDNMLAALTNGQSKEKVYREIRNITKHIRDSQLVKLLRNFRKKPFTNENSQEIIDEIKDYLSQRLILTWSKKRAKRDKAKRDLLVAKAQQLADVPAESLSQRGPRRYLKVTSQEISLFHEKIQLDAQWDGFYGIYTNNQELDWQQIIEHYRNLWKIEESFRILKSHFGTRPIFHWTPKRIEGHLVLCFIAFLFERTIEIKLRERQLPCSPRNIRDALLSMQASLVDVQGQKFYLTSKINGLGKDILKFLRIKTPAKIVPVEQFERNFLTFKG